MIPIHSTGPARLAAWPGDNAGPDANAALCKDCAAALEFDFDFAFQPIVDVRERRIVAHEALVRGTRGEGAESVMLQVTPATMYGFDQRCRTLAIERAAALGMRERLSINFIANAVRDPRHCVRSTLAAARAFHFPLEQIMFEVTGRQSVDDRGHLIEIFNAYREYGFQTALDDFGADHGGLTLLADFRPDIVKIDMHLVRNIDRDPARQAIVAGLVAMCRALGVRMLGKGVETRAERNFLAGAGVELMQGYWFCHPVFQGLGVVDPDKFA
jgi:EAL domain-containing protein (putative c-di-GMP-specific phosphodiesterase class I)